MDKLVIWLLLKIQKWLDKKVKSLTIKKMYEDFINQLITYLEKEDK